MSDKRERAGTALSSDLSSPSSSYKESNDSFKAHQLGLAGNQSYELYEPPQYGQDNGEGYTSVPLSEGDAEDTERPSLTQRKVSVLSVPEDHPKMNTALFVYCVCYTVAAANEYWVVNWLKEKDVNLPIFMAIVQNASWPVQMLFYYWELQKLKTPRIITAKMYRSYFFLGFLAAFIGLSRMYGLSSLPPTLYVICANTEIVFETAMTKLILKRDVTFLQYIAVFLVLSAVILSLYNPNDNVFGQGDSNSSTEYILIGVGLSLASRFASSLNTILAEKFLGKDVKSKIGVSECAVANSVVPFFIVPVMLLVIPEYKRWDKELIHPGDTYLTTVLSLLFIALCFSKHIDRLSKYGIVDESSTIFFAGVDAQMKMIAGVGSFFFFGEEITWTIIVGFGLIAVSVVIMFIDKIRKQHLIEAEKERQREKTRLEHAEAGHVHNVLVVR